MKRVLSLMLAMIMSVMLLAGCSSSELSYLSLMTEVSSWQTTNSKGSFTLNVNDNVARQVSTDYELGTVDIPVNKIVVDYDITCSTVTSDCSIDLDITVDDIKVSAECAFYNNSVYISKDTIKGIDALLEKYNTGVNDATEICDFVIDKMGDAKWFVYQIPEEEIKDALSVDTARFSKIISDFLTSAFKDYETGLFSGNVSKGLTFNMTPDNIENFLTGFMKYLIEHRAEIVEIGDILVADIYESCSELKEIVEPDHTACGFEDCDSVYFDSLIPSEEVLQDNYDTLVEGFKSQEYLKVVRDFKGSHLTEKIFSPASGELKAESKFAVIYKGKKLIDCKAEQSTTVMNSYDGVDGTTYICDLDTMEDEYVDYINSKYPANHVDIKWTSGDYKCEPVDYKCMPGDYAISADITFDRNSPTESNRVSFSQDYVNVPLVNQDGRIYVPMRKLAEGMGYDVEWNAEESKAYVITDVQKIDMSGIIVNGTTFIKVRDFEKLGLEIGYSEHHEGEFNYSTYTATIDRYCYNR